MLHHSTSMYIVQHSETFDLIDSYLVCLATALIFENTSHFWQVGRLWIFRWNKRICTLFLVCSAMTAWGSQGCEQLQLDGDGWGQLSSISDFLALLKEWWLCKRLPSHEQPCSSLTCNIRLGFHPWFLGSFGGMVFYQLGFPSWLWCEAIGSL